ncbi:MAG: T9SS type A sorting domain-containing protein, partial [Candidatus Zixiibacteriota bacterium]
QNYPNPFNPITTLAFSVPYSVHTTVEVYNILGEKVKTIFDGVANAGTNYVTWNGTGTEGETVASGIYFYRMKAADFEKTRKMVLMK